MGVLDLEEIILLDYTQAEIEESKRKWCGPYELVTPCEKQK